jgi:hypothetical protein
MIKFLPKTLTLALACFLGFGTIANAQFLKDLNNQVQIPNIKNINSSDAHLYVLSESEGLVVFRTHSDSLQWLYSSTGMQERGHILQSDIRFAYLYGNNRRLTVIEPTSVLGVYSSTILPRQPLAVHRIGHRLFLALGSNGLGEINLETPETVDTDVNFIDAENHILDLTGDNLNTLYVLNNRNEITIYEADDENINRLNTVSIDRNVQRVFLSGNELIGTSQNGNIFLINDDGNTRTIGSVSGSVERLSIWDDKLIVRTRNHELWAGPVNGDLEIWASGERSGNYFTISEDKLWVSEYNSVAPVISSGDTAVAERQQSSGTGFRLQPIENVVLPFPRPLLLPIEFETDVDLSQVSMSYNAPFNNARIRGNTFYWQPSANQSGRHPVTIVATSADGRADSTSFTVDLRPFNSPPRFSQTRPVSIPVDEEFELQISAVDPDGMDQNLIRYLGVDMPDGASLNERTGMFTWTPNVRQVGEHQFQVIATDQFGAAASQDFTINVIEIEEGDPIDEDLF